MKRIKTPNKSTKKTVKSKKFYVSLCAFCLLFIIFSSGCNNKFFDPSQIGRFRPTPAVNVILNSLGVAEEEPLAWEGAEEPRPMDTKVLENDYVFMPGDTVMIAVYELFQESVMFANEFTITETGKISIPDVGVVQASGLTEVQVEEEIKQILSPNILRDPSVLVTLVSSQQRTFSILGDGVSAPSRYVIPRMDFRLTDALATAGGARQFNVSNIYVSRFTRGRANIIDRPLDLEIMEPEFPEIELFRPDTSGPQELEELFEPEQEMPEIITPLALRQNRWPKSKVVIASAELATAREYAQAAWPKGFDVSEQSWDSVAATPEPSSRLASPERKEESVSIKDILKTLSERNRQERTNRATDVESMLKPAVRPTVPERTEKPTDIDEILKSFDEPTFERFEEPIDMSAGETMIPSAEQEEITGTFEPFTRRGFAETTEEQVYEGDTGRIEWIFQDGKWVPVEVGHPFRPESAGPTFELIPEPTGPTAPRRREMTMPSYDLGETAQTRVIKIPVDRLLAGDPQYNIVIKPGDSIFVPIDIVGEFCIMGNVNYQGYITITGRPMTLKMAIAAAGGLSPLAWPKKCEVIRRIGRDKEEIVMVDLDKIASGEQPDFFIKPNDLINVGTHTTSVWRTVLRNAFGASYGFGFVYDRNFADRDYGNSVWPF